MEYIKAFFTGVKTGIDYWEVVVFNNRIPRGVCWLIAIITIPINISLIGVLLMVKSLREWHEEMVLEIDGKKQEDE